MDERIHVFHRYPEIDLLRTAAILGMVIYHTAYDLGELYGWNIDVLDGGWRLFARSTAILFLLVSGASNTIANARASDRSAMWRRTLARGSQIAAGAFLVTVVTWCIDRETYIRFGILHCIAVSVFLLPLFKNFRQWNVLLGIGIIATGNVIAGITADTSLLLPLGIFPPGFISLDYFPLLPWFGVVLLGSAVADYLYMQKEFKGTPLSIQLPGFALINRHALVVYLVHQPIILLFLAIILRGIPKL